MNAKPIKKGYELRGSLDMFTEQKIEIRRAILTRLKVGKYTIVSTLGAKPEDAIAYAEKFGKGRGRAIVGERIDKDHVKLTEVLPEKRPPGRPTMDPAKLKYPIGTLEVGDSVLIKLPKSEHSKVRKYASARAADTGWRYSCNSEPDGIRVIRLA